ncbi:GDSL lipase/esterase [Cristinia sonorae]|uniref:GDSL lipase/esterase n=1 Tax=Cristinia sonorae TaxID=1940300 RepID=A0A8K0UIK3_9AGAR|nr:GDSL lipase/esterase [Cristinia sonorae]
MLTFKCSSLVSLVFATISLAAGPLPNQIKNLVTFGDSYTDVVNTGDGGTAWPVYAARDGKFNLFPFARSGATCSNNITNRPFPSVFESQLPLFFSEKANGTLRSLKASDTIFTLWIGTNDVGANALLTGNGINGATIVDTVSCAINWIKTLYRSGARNFLFQNMIPLQKVILYSATSYPNRFWTGPRNTTEWSVGMTELTQSGNEIAKLMLQALPRSLPGAHIGLFDSHALFTEMLAHPQLFLNGTAPLNITGAVRSCVFPEGADTSNNSLASCTIATGTDVDSFLWFDELHPSEQADRVVAREVAAAIHRQSSKFTTWFS